MSKSVFLGFDFYGAGNIGDDLMLDGFLRSIQTMRDGHLKFVGMVPHDLHALRGRFSGVEWLGANNSVRRDILMCVDAWVGMGGTPFQYTSGSWLMEKILTDIRAVGPTGLPMFMVGVGAEREAMARQDMVNAIVGRMQHIWTRDKFSSQFLYDVTHSTTISCRGGG